MARDNIFLTYVIVDLLFVATGGLLMGFAFVTLNEEKQTPTLNTVTRNLLLARCPLNGQSWEILGRWFGEC